MLKNDFEGLLQPAQPLLRGINLAKFLCDRCPFQELTKGRDGKNRSCSGLPPSDETTTSGVSEELADHNILDLPGRL